MDIVPFAGLSKNASDGRWIGRLEKVSEGRTRAMPLGRSSPCTEMARTKHSARGMATAG